MAGRILIVEDDPSIAEIVRETLRGLGRPIAHVAGGVEALEELAKNDVGLVVLDLKINGLHGMEVCRRARKKGSHVPMLILTSAHEEIDRIIALEFGADDYLTKPFSVRELLARVHALLRRSEFAQSAGIQPVDKTVRVGELSINLDRCTVHRGAQSLPITFIHPKRH